MKRKQIRNFLFVFFLSLIFVHNLHSQEPALIQKSRLPAIHKLSSTDNIFKQFSQTVQYNEKINANNPNSLPEIEFYLYEAKKYDDILSIHADTGIPYDTLITLNSISNPNTKLENKKLIIPTAKGIFLTDQPETNIERLIFEEFRDFFSKSEKLCYNLDGRTFCFLPEKRLTPTQRAFFLDPSMQLPLRNISITSAYGFRNSPIYNRWKFHKGIDLAAKDGTPVYACQNGRVKQVLSMDSIFGNCIVLQHENSYTSIYAHLSSVNVKPGDVVAKGNLIGYSGHTGAVTGPHLHFEIRMNGEALNPEEVLDFSGRR